MQLQLSVRNKLEIKSPLRSLLGKFKAQTHKSSMNSVEEHALPFRIRKTCHVQENSLICFSSLSFNIPL